MIQRIQSVFLALIVVIFMILLFAPVYNVPVFDRVSGKTGLSLMDVKLLLIILAVITLLAVVCIFLYRDRKKQMMICRIGVLLSALVNVNALVFSQFFIHGVDKSTLGFGYGAYLLPVNIILFALAGRYIKKDDDLVKAADRLR